MLLQQAINHLFGHLGNVQLVGQQASQISIKEDLNNQLTLKHIVTLFSCVLKWLLKCNYWKMLQIEILSNFEHVIASFLLLKLNNGVCSYDQNV